MAIVKVSLETPRCLTAPLEDFLVGVLNAVVESAADGAPSVDVLNAYMVLQEERQLETIKRQVLEHASELAAIFNVELPRVAVETVVEQDWSESWKQFFHPFEIVPGLIIAPKWESYQRNDEDHVIVMDPGMAFGTGHHATTRMCLTLLRQAANLHEQKGPVLDVGTGTGILAMAASLFGFNKVLAIDNDPDAVAAATANVDNNGRREQVTVTSTPLAELNGSFRVIVANIVHDTLQELADHLDRLCCADGLLIVSGLICGKQVDSLIRRFTGVSFVVEQQLADGEWCALMLRKTP